ncbi:hypothetical protein SDJN03_07463, partial [Cucurbita argyrosperma subsp. sororia]
MFPLHLHTAALAARTLLPSSSSRVGHLHLPLTVRKLPETASSTSSSLRQIPKSGPNPTQNKLKPTKLRS